MLLATLLFFFLQSVEVSSSERNSYVHACYFTNWAQYRPGRGRFQPEDYVPGLCTHILYAFAGMTYDYSIRNVEDNDLPNRGAGIGNFRRVNALKEKQPGLKTLISVGGWNFGTGPFKAMSSSPANRKRFIDSAIEFSRKWGFDGIDIDWEYPEEPDKANYATFIKELRDACQQEATSSGKSRLLVTAAVAAAKARIEKGYDVTALAQHFDFIFLMTYDFYGAWDNNVGFNSPLYSREGLPAEEKPWNVDSASQIWAEKGMPKEKIIVGVPMYGRGWTLPDPADIQPGRKQGAVAAPAQPYAREAGIASYYEICDMIKNGGQTHWHDEHQVPFLVKGSEWWSYDNEKSVRNKMSWLKSKGYGGAFVWDLDFDDFNGQSCNGKKYPLISLIAEELGGKIVTTEKPATTTASSTISTTFQPTTGTSTSSRRFTCSQDGFFPDPTNCLRFYRCHSGVAYSFACAAGTSFHADTKLCDHTDLSKCSDRL